MTVPSGSNILVSAFGNFVSGRSHIVGMETSVVPVDVVANARAIGWPEQSLQALVNCAATAVQDFRLGLASIEEATSADEAELAGQWRQFHEFDAKLIDNPSHYLSLLRGTLVWLNILGQAGSPDQAHRA